MIWFVGERTYLDDSMFSDSENEEFHRGTTRPAKRLPEYEQIDKAELFHSED